MVDSSQHVQRSLGASRPSVLRRSAAAPPRGANADWWTGRTSPWAMATAALLSLGLLVGVAVFQIQSIFAEMRASDQVIAAMAQSGRLDTLIGFLQALPAAGTAPGDVQGMISLAELERLNAAAGLPTRLPAPEGAIAIEVVLSQTVREARQIKAEAERKAASRTAVNKRVYRLLLLNCSLGLAFLAFAGVFVVNHALQISDMVQRLWQARRAVMKAERDRAGILATAGHDLRQPLQAIRLFVSALMHRAPDPPNRMALRKIESATDSMQRMIEGLLDLAKLDAGLVAADLVDVQLWVVIQRLVDEFSPMADEKGLFLGAQPTTAVVHTDPLLLETILRNLIGNAVRYTSQGRVDVTVEPEGAGVTIGVSDTGCGIGPHEAASIFQDFYRVEREGSGLGLGLGIVRRQATLLRTAVAVTSVLGEGSSFRFTLPKVGDAPAPPMAVPGPVGTLPARLVFLLDNDADVLTGFATLFRSWGLEVVCAKSGAETRSVLTDATLAQVDLAVLDYDLNDTTGMAVLAELRQRKPNLPGMIITGSPRFEAVKAQAGDDCLCLRKPVQDAVLYEAIMYLAEASRSPSA